MYIDNKFNSPTFGYKFPKDIKNSYIKDWATTESGALDREYLEQVNHFIAKRFNGEKFIQEYDLSNLSKAAYKEFIKMCEEFHVPCKKWSFKNIILRKRRTVEDFNFKDINVELSHRDDLHNSSWPTKGHTVYIKGIPELDPKMKAGPHATVVFNSYKAFDPYPFDSESGLKFLENKIDRIMENALLKRLESIVKTEQKTTNQAIAAQKAAVNEEEANNILHKGKPSVFTGLWNFFRSW